MGTSRHYAVNIIENDNGLVLFYVIKSQWPRRDVITRGHLTYDLEEGRPTLRHMIEDVLASLRSRVAE